MRHIGVGTFTTTPRMRELVNQVLDTGRISYGPLSREFERRFAEIHERKFAVLSNSGTSSLQVALQAMKELYGWQDGDEVIVPAVTFVATVNVVLHNNLKPVLVDVEPDYYGLNWEGVRLAITPRTRAMIPVHLFGQPDDMQELQWYGRRLKIIEDSCETMFVRHHGKMVGFWGDVACFSTYVAHLLTTGVGGLALTDDPELAAVIRSLVNHGRDGIYMSIDDDDKPTEEIIARRFLFKRIGHSYRITELEAALGLAQLDGWREMIAARRHNAEYLNWRLRVYRNRLQLPATRPDTEHSWMMYPIVLRNEPKTGLVNWLEEHGIETRDMMPLTNQPCYAGMWNPDDYPVAKWINESGFYIGCHQNLSISDLDYIYETIDGYFENLRLRHRRSIPYEQAFEQGLVRP